MLVCNVSLRPARTAITATIAEAVTAVDATATGNVVFATLVDDPASVLDILDAYLGEIMVEAASASDDISAGSVYETAIDEAMTAADVQASTLGGPARMAMVAGLSPAFVNSTASHTANVIGTMANL